METGSNIKPKSAKKAKPAVWIAQEAAVFKTLNGASTMRRLSTVTTKGRLATILIALTIFGCKGPLQTSAASAGEGANGGVNSGSTGDGASGASSSGGGTRVEYIKDPTLNNMDAIPVKYPANWKFQGVLFQPGNCANNTYVVWRATSPDGKSFAERMPVFGWTYGSGPWFASWPKNGCLPMNGPITAVDFAKYMTGLLHVQAVGVKPFLDAEKTALEQDAQQRQQRAEGANVLVRFMNGSTPMKGGLRVVVRCTDKTFPAGPAGAGSTVDHCEANVGYSAAPEAEFAKVQMLWSAPGMGQSLGTDAWQQAWTQRFVANSQRQTRDMVNRANDYMNASNARFNAEQEGYRRQAAVQQQMHNEFMNTMQRGTDMSMQRTSDAMNARTTAASDWVDYALDRRTVMDTNTGQIYKTGNQITPGGAAVQVHGNGTPY